MTSASTPYDYFSLLKPRVMSLVVFTGLCGVALAPEEIHLFFAFVAVLTIALGSGAAGAVNMWYERELDRKMPRTAERPTVTGVISPDNALAFGVILASLSVMLLGLTRNWLAAGLLLTAIGYYVFIYTIWLKPRTPQNIVIGGAAGAFPPVIGWAAVTGEVALEPLLMFALIFFWTPPHFWALALKVHTQYRQAKIPMLPVTHGAQATKKQIVIYSLILLPVAVSFYYPFGFAGPLYGIISAVMSLEFIRRSVKLLKDEENITAMALFRYSIFYLFVLFAVLVFDNFYRQHFS